MFTKYVLLAFSGDHIDANLVRVLITKLIDNMKKLKMTNILQAQETTSNQQWNHAFKNRRRYPKKKFTQFGDQVLWFPKG
jgi:hypothetical protein